jgi:hypothetical protein
VVQCLIKVLGANIHHVDQTGRTALEYAHSAGHDSTVGIVEEPQAMVGVNSKEPAEGVASTPDVDSPSRSAQREEDKLLLVAKGEAEELRKALRMVEMQLHLAEMTADQERREKTEVAASAKHDKDTIHSLELTLARERRELSEAKSNAASQKQSQDVQIKKAAQDKQQLEVKLVKDMREVQAQVGKMHEKADEAQKMMRAKAEAEQKRSRALLAQAKAQTVQVKQEAAEERSARQGLEQAATQEKSERKRLEEELTAARALAAVPVVERVSGLPDIELRAVEDAARVESMRRHAHQEVQRAVEQERVEVREARLCEICLDNSKDIALNCGHQACAGCAEGLVNCHICRQIITARIRLY